VKTERKKHAREGAPAMTADSPLDKVARVLGFLYVLNEYLRLAESYTFLKAISPATSLALLLGILALVLTKPSSEGARQIAPALGLFILAGGISMLGAASFDYAWIAWTDLLKMSLGAWLLSIVMADRRGVTWTLWALLLANFKLSQFQIRGFKAGYATEDAEMKYHIAREGVGVGSQGFFGNAGDFGVAMCTIIPLAIALGLYGATRLQRWTGWLLAASFGISIIYTGSRGGMVGLAAVGLVYVVRSKRYFAGLLAVAIGLAALWMMAPPEMQGRVRATGSESDGTGDFRTQLWVAGAHMIADHPLTGVGIGNYGLALAQRYFVHGGRLKAGWEMDPHNVVIQAASEMGVLGVVVLVVVVVVVVRQGRYARRVFARAGADVPVSVKVAATACPVMFAGYFASGQFISVLYYPHIFYILALSGMAHSALRSWESAQKPPTE
jgi:hypothetical protein